MSPVEGLGQLVRDELARSGSRQSAATRTGGLGHVVRLLALLHRTVAELDEATAAFLDNVELQDELEAASGSADTELFEEGGRLSETVHLRVDTFYALSRALLDSTARAVERYFGPAEGAPLGAHLELEANLADFAERNGLAEPPPRLREAADRLTAEIFAEHDRHIRFGRATKLWTASTWLPSGDASISPASKGHGSSPQELVEMIEDYLAEVVRYLSSNQQAERRPLGDAGASRLTPA